MISIRSSADLARALDGSLDPDLRLLLQLRRDQLINGSRVDLGELVHIVVVQPADTRAAVEEEAGVPIAAHVEWVARHGAWLEAVTIHNDDGYATALFCPDCIRVDPAVLLPLLALV